jgi:hypothetical protein
MSERAHSDSRKDTYVYCGTMDDFAARNTFREGDRELRAINETLVRSVLVGDRPLIGDGYLTSHPALRQAIKKPDSSPLTELARCGWVKISDRTGEGALEKVGEQQKKNGVSQPGGVDDREFAECLPQWADALRRRQEISRPFLNWPAYKIHDGFLSTLEHAKKDIDEKRVTLDVPEHVLQEFFTDFFSRYRSDPTAPRTKWETIGIEWLRTANKGFDQGHYDQLMRLANATYHVNFSRYFAKHHNVNMRVLTHHTELFSSFFKACPLPDAMPAELKLPLLRVDKQLFHNGKSETWRRLAQLAAHPTQELLEAKQQYRAELDKLLKCPDDATQQVQLRQAADAYSRLISEFFGTWRGPHHIAEIIHCGFIFGVIPACLLAGVPEHVAHFAVALLGVWVADRAVPMVMQRFVTRDGDHFPNQAFDRTSVVPGLNMSYVTSCQEVDVEEMDKKVAVADPF